VISEIKNRVTIESVLGDVGVTLTRGRAGCPLCGSTNKTAFSVKNGRAHCFRCGFHGDVVDLYRGLHGTDTKTAIRHLAARAGLSYGPMTPSERAAMQKAQAEAARRKALKEKYRAWCHEHEIETATALRTLRKIKDEWTDFTQKGLEGLALIQEELDYCEYFYDCLCHDERARLALYKERKA